MPPLLVLHNLWFNGHTFLINFREHTWEKSLSFSRVKAHNMSAWAKNLKRHEAFNLFGRADTPWTSHSPHWCLKDQKINSNSQKTLSQQSSLTLSKFLPGLKRCWKKKSKVSKVLGHSVGEYAALAAAGVLSFEDASAVHLRGKFMQEAVAPAKARCTPSWKYLKKLYAKLAKKRALVEL